MSCFAAITDTTRAGIRRYDIAERCIQYQENLGFPADDERRMFLFSIHGDAGVGKTYLTQHLRRLAIRQGALTAYINETVEDPASAMRVIQAILKK